MDRWFDHVHYPVAQANLSVIDIRRSGLCETDTNQLRTAVCDRYANNTETRVSHDLARLPGNFAPLAAILDDFRGARTDLDQFVGELVDKLDEQQQLRSEAQTQFDQQRESLEAQVSQLQADLERSLESDDAASAGAVEFGRLNDELAKLREEFQAKETQLHDMNAESEAVREDRDQLQAALGELEQKTANTDTTARQAQQLQQQLAASQDEIASLHEQLSSAASTDDTGAAEQLEQMTKQKQEMQSELDTVRKRAVELGEKLRETERLAAEERVEWTAELRQMRKLLEQPAAAAPAQPQAPAPAATPMVNMPAAAATPADAVLTNVMAQFELVQQDVQRHRSAG